MSTLAESPDCEPRCPGCAHRHLDAAASVAQKTDWLRRRLAPWADTLSALRCPAPERRRDYRDKVALWAGWQDGRWGFGLLADDELVAIPRCPVHTPRVRAVQALLARRLPPPERFPLAFLAQAGAQATLIVKSRERPDLDWLTDEVSAGLAAAGLEGLWLHLHPSAGRRLFAKNGWTLLWGAPESRDGDGLVYGPTAFQQLLPELYRQALDEAQAFLAPGAGCAVVDLYCGSGASLRRWITAGARAIGVELSAEAVANAARNAPGAEVLRGLCAQRLAQLTPWLAAGDAGETRLAYLNPPRTGLEPEVLQWLIDTARPRRLAYLSCSAGTLHRDLTALCAGGYRVRRITPYDFFPQTYHVETLALLEAAS